MLMCSNFVVGSVMGAVFLLGQNNPLSDMLIYGPIVCIFLVTIYDKYAISYILSVLLAIVHGLAHVFYPFLNDTIGVNRQVSVVF